MKSKIAIVLGSIRIGRESHKVGELLHKKLSENENIESVLLDLATYDLPMMEQTSGHQPPHEGLLKFSQNLKRADGMIFISPEYNGSYTGVFKNAIDYFWKEFDKKPIGAVTISTGKFGGITASIQMQHLILALGAYAMPKKLLFPFVKKSFDEQGNLVDEKMEKEVGDFLGELIWLTEAISMKKSKESAGN